MILRTRAPGKINLCLYVGPTDPETGLHTLVSLMEPLSLADDLELGPAFGASADVVECEGVEGPNLAAAALARFRETTRYGGPPVLVRIVKRIPVAAGIPGRVQRRRRDPASRRAARRGGGRARRHRPERLGSDVPALVRTDPAFVAGTGEEVMWLDPLPPHAVVLVPSTPGLSAALVYAEADRLELPRSEGNLARKRESLEESFLLDELPKPVNDLQRAVLSLRPDLSDTLAAVYESGAQYSFVTGSGPTVAGLFPGADGLLRAQGAVARLRADHPGAVAASPVDGAFGEVSSG